MKSYSPKVGDLVCFNSAGMRKHSLGLVMERRKERLHGDGRYVPYLYIHWIKKPPMSPRSEWHWGWTGVTREARWTPDGSIAAWYQDMGHFEVVEK